MGTLKLNSNTETEKTQEQATAVERNDISAEGLMLTVSDLESKKANKEMKKICGEHEATFKDANGAEKKIIYSSPAFYRDECSGEYAEIKNELTDEGDEIVNKENFYKVRFDKHLKGGKIFDITKGKNSVSLYTTDAAANMGRSACTCGLCREDNSVTYIGLNGADIHYTAFNDRIKEDIIITQRQDNYVYNFKLSVGDMIIEEGKNCNLLLKDANTGEVQFEIPAPYMFDANGVRSNDVEYEFDVIGGELELKVTASAEFINAEERAFPVIIDPQIIATQESTGAFDFLSWYNLGDGGEDTEYPGALEVNYFSGSGGTNASITIYKDKLPKVDGTIKSVVLQITAQTGCRGSFSFYSRDYYQRAIFKAEVNKTYKLDVTEDYLSKSSVFSAYLAGEMESGQTYSSDVTFYTSGPNMPKLTITYEGALVEPDNEETGGNDYNSELESPNFKELELGDMTTGYLNLNDGVLTSVFDSFGKLDLTVPVSISNVHRIGVGTGIYGKNWRLNLNRQLKASVNDNETNTVLNYVDEFGDRYTFTETYYYLENEEKKFINKNRVEINEYGDLSYNGKEVFKKQCCNGLTLVPEINDFKGVEFLELKQKEQLELEEYLTSCEASFTNMVIYNTENPSDNSCEEINTFDKEVYDSISYTLLFPDYILMSRSEYFQYDSINKSKQQLNLQKDQLDQQIKETQQLINQYKKENEQGTTSTEERILAYQNAITNKKIFERQYDNIVNVQIPFLESQQVEMKGQARKNLPQIKEAFGKYFAKKAQLELLKKQTPVNYLKDENGLISGFNAQGNLVCIFDSYENYVAIDYDAKNRISALTDNTGKTVSFKYANGLLQSITDNRGRTVSYAYDGAALQTVTFADGKTLSFKYNDKNFRTILSSDGYEAKFNFLDGKLSSVTNTGSVPETGTISEITFVYGTNGTTISDNEGNKEEYTFYDSKRIKSHAVTDGTLVTTTTNYEYVNDGGKQTKAVTSNNVDDKTSTVIEKLNDLELPVSRTEDWQKISDTVSVKTVTNYAYDSADKLIKQTITKFTETQGAEPPITEKTSVTNYHYDANGSLILTESFVEGEEQTGGVNFEQKVYNDRGAVVREIKWNSLDSSSRFYTEADLADDGRVVAERDETGEVCAEYEYANGTSTPNAVKYANGSKFAYGRSGLNDTVTSVTQSTADGEANVTDITYQYGLPVKVKSGNTEIEYGYDAKGRKTSVTVNGRFQSSYTYGKFTINDANNKANYGTFKQVYRVNGDDAKFETEKTAIYDEASKVRKVREKMYVDGKYDLSEYIKEYNADGTLSNVLIGSDTTVNYAYDKYGKLTEVKTMKAGADYMNETYAYNGNAELTKKTVTGAAEQTYYFSYKDNAAHDLDYISFGSYNFKPLTDVNGRNIGREVLYYVTTKIAGEYISYRKVGDHATGMPSTIWFGKGTNIKDSIKYKYDKCGNICEVIENGHVTAKYTYDGLNRIVREDNKPLNKTVVYTYDNNGNITERCEYAYTRKTGEELTELKCTHYNYDYDGDKLVSYNGENFSYNEQGSPTTYRGKAASWKYGRLLSSYNGTNFYYDCFGKRTQKGNITFVYDNEGKLIKQSNGLEFIYDAGGVIGVKYKNAQYFYRRDARGNIIAVLDSSGNVVVKYVYDAWGNHAVVDANGNDIEDMENIGNVNPFRYNGYYYDTETGFYYLKSRYYDPELGRFISQDSIEYADPETINGLNLYAYCANNPVMYCDPTGRSKVGNWFKNLGHKIKNAFTSAWNGVCNAFTAVVDFFKDYGALIGTGLAAFGVLIGCTVFSIFAPPIIPPSIRSIIFGAGVGFFTGVVENMHSQISANGYKNFDYKQAFLSGGIGAAIGAVSGFFSYAFGEVLKSVGEFFGLALGNATINGLQLGKVFSFLGGVQSFSALGGFVGGIVGGIVGGAFGNKYMNNLFNRYPNSGQNMYEGISGTVLDKFIDFFKWVIRF